MTGVQGTLFVCWYNNLPINITYVDLKHKLDNLTISDGRLWVKNRFALMNDRNWNIRESWNV